MTFANFANMAKLMFPGSIIADGNKPTLIFPDRKYVAIDSKHPCYQALKNVPGIKI